MRLSEGRFLNFLTDFAESLARPWAMEVRFWSFLLVASGDPKFTLQVQWLRRKNLPWFIRLPLGLEERHKWAVLTEFGQYDPWVGAVLTKFGEYACEAEELRNWGIKKLRNTLRLSRGQNKLRNLRLWQEAGIS